MFLNAFWVLLYIFKITVHIKYFSVLKLATHFFIFCAEDELSVL